MSIEFKTRNSSCSERNSFFKNKEKDIYFRELCSFNMKYAFNMHKSAVFEASIVVCNVELMM